MADLYNIPSDPETFTMHGNINKLFERRVVTEQTQAHRSEKPWKHYDS